MNRRDVLRRAGALAGIGALAGCASDSNGSGGNGGDETTDGDGSGGGEDTTEAPTSTAPPTPSITSKALETTKQSCMSGESGSASVSADGMALTVTGTIKASNPCHEAVLAGATYSADKDHVEVTVRAESDGSGACQQCIGAIEYEGTVEFDGRLPAKAVVTHQEMGETVTAGEADL
jgi:hypothetical protein